MTTNKIVEKTGKLLHRTRKVVETVLKDAGNVVNAYRLKEDPVAFSIEVLNFKPFEYQSRLLKDRSKRIVACMGRQTGKSTTIAAKAIHYAATNKGKTILIVSATLRQSMLMFDKIINFVELSSLSNAVKYRSRTKVVFTNGSKIIALPCGNDGNTLRGFSADVVILDEAAFMPEHVITSVVMPMISTTQGRVWMLSTPWERKHVFYKAFNDERWSKYHLPSSANPLITDDFLQEQKKLIGEDMFSIEYLAQFIDDSNSYFPMSLIRQCVNEHEYDLDGELFAGYDPGGKQSYAAFVIVRREKEHLFMVYKKSEKSKSYTEFTDELNELYKRKNFFMLVDETGLGSPIVEHAKQLGMEAEGVVLTDRKKEEVLSNLKIMMETRKIAIPYDEELMHSLNAIEYKKTRVGNLLFEKRKNSYDDLAYALALACYASYQKGSEGIVIVI